MLAGLLSAKDRLLTILREPGGYASATTSSGARGQLWAYSDAHPDGVRFAAKTIEPLIADGLVAVSWDSRTTATYTLKSSALGGLKTTVPASALDYAARKLDAKMKRCGVTKAELRTGMKVELEHKDVTKGGIEKTARIALAHLCERKDYYQRLKKYVER